MTAAPAIDHTRTPRLKLLAGRHRRALEGHPWIYSNEVEMTQALKALAPGSLVEVDSHDGRSLGVGFANPHSLVVCRLIAREAGVEIDRRFFADRLQKALALRRRLYGQPYYRLIHAEADGLPGTVVDRFGGLVVVQLNTAGMDRLTQEFLAALEATVAPEAIVLKNDSALRQLEGLPQSVTVAKGVVEPPIELVENGFRFYADPIQGQKTGWFYDQRDNRRAVAELAAGARTLDVYSHTGGFGVLAASMGAHAATLLDRSELALALAGRAAEANGVAERCRFLVGDAFIELQRLAKAGERFDVVVADPPAFVRSKKDLTSGLKGYRKLAQLAAEVVSPGGFLFAASCSHNVDAAAFQAEVAHGLGRAGRSARILRAFGAGADHPVHPFLPESAYLKSLLLQLD
ncbi:MAG: class I SAM-dependent rRNA methyltransferase [Proteobacteria bacterium]|nr:class I SAM-dependent rRNA methyltransferase [Pseudomonadota bacterium]MBI3499688.1 class I SAM-dependent rRNA methyltransferase [Pseudomonadota bacterium]